MASEEKIKLWFAATPQQDDEVREAFASHLDPARAAKWDDLGALSPAEQIALVVLLDQFPRHIHRQTGEQFAYDAAALDIARKLIGLDRSKFKLDELRFLYLPFEHSEDQADQDLCVFLFAQLAFEVLGRARERPPRAGPRNKTSRRHPPVRPFPAPQRPARAVLDARRGRVEPLL